MLEQGVSGPEPAVRVFCNAAVDQGREACRVRLEGAWSEGTGVYWCHGRCLQERRGVVL
jgi:hypothetical protein